MTRQPILARGLRKKHFGSFSALALVAGLAATALQSPAMAQQFVCAGGNGSATGQNAFSCGNDATASGQSSSASGYHSTASGNGSTASGAASTASGFSATALGFSSTASGDGSTALGYGSTASGYLSAALGSSVASGDFSTASGYLSTASGYLSTASGPISTASGSGSTASGFSSYASGSGSAAYGNGASAGGLNGSNAFTNAATVAIGRSAQAGATGSGQTNATALGDSALANVANGTALGQGTSVTQAGGVALGQGTAATRAGLSGAAEVFSGAVVASTNGAVSVGTAGGERQITNLAGGTQDTDAVNLRQLRSVGGNLATALGGGASFHTTTGAFTGPTYTFQDGTQFNNVGSALGNLDTRTAAITNSIATLQAGQSGLVWQVGSNAPITLGASSGGSLVKVAGTAGDRQITGIAAGSLSANSVDAVNGNQLFATNQQVATNAQNVATTNRRTASVLGGGAGVDASGLLTAPSYAVQGSTYNNVGGALGALDTATTRNTQNIAINTIDISALQSGQSGPFRNNNTSGYAAPVASGSDAVAGGFGSIASGQQSTAIGTGAQATRAGAVAIGAFAQATADPTTAVGFAAAATGSEASAFGAFAIASGDNSTALGRSATAAGTSSTAVGFASNASGPGSVAVGVGASASQANSVAIGTGVKAARANQVAIGTAGQTYTLAGLTSAQSSAAQSGPTGFVTTDANGNLAASGYGPAQLAQMDGRISSLQNSVTGLQFATVRLQRQVRDAFTGSAIALSLSGASLPEGKTYAVSGGFGTYNGSTGMGFTGIVRVSDDLYASGGVGFGTSARSNVGGRGSLMYAW